MLKRSLLVLLCIVSTLLLVSCEDDTNTVTVFEKGNSKYTIVYPYNAENIVVRSALFIANTAEDKTGAIVNVDSDKSVSRVDKACEILVGNTNRDISKSLLPESPLDYVIAMHENSLVIIGGSDTATADAADYLCQNIISSPKTSLDKDFIYRHSHDYTDFILNYKEITGFTVSGHENVDIEKVIVALESTTGMLCNTDQANTNIEFRLDYELNDNTIRLSSYNGNIVISASSIVALTMIDEVIADNFPSLDSIDLSGDAYIDLTYPTVSVLSLPEDFEKYFTCSTNKSPMEYALGEEIIFNLTLKCDGEPITAPGFYYTLESDFDSVQKRENVIGESSNIEIRTSIDKPGFVKLYVAAVSEKSVELKGVSPFNGGAGAATGEIVKAIAEPDDFDAFWQNELEHLYNTEPVLTYENDLSHMYPGYIVKDIRIDCPAGPVSAYVTMPENTEPGSLDILVGFAGYGVFPIEPSMREDKIVMTVNAHSIENGQDENYYRQLSNTSLYSYGFSNTENADRDTVYFKNMILRDLQALRYLKTLKEWNGENISLNGGSQGAFQSIAVAALDPDVNYLFAAYTWLCDIGAATQGRIPGWQPDYTDALLYYDAVSFAKRIKCQSRIDAGLGDYTSPPSGITALVNSMSAPVTLNMTQGMTHRYTPPETETYTVYK